MLYMFKCNDCGGTFEDPKIVNEYRGEFWGQPSYEEVGYCPYCGSDDWGEKEIDDEDL